MRGRDWALALGAAGTRLWLPRRLYREANKFNFMGKVVLKTSG
jgi:hypothetical protein